MGEAAPVVDLRAEHMQQSYPERYNLRARPKDFNVGEEVLVIETGPVGKMQPRWSQLARSNTG